MTRRRSEFNLGGQGAAGLACLTATLEQIALGSQRSSGLHPPPSVQGEDGAESAEGRFDGGESDTARSRRRTTLRVFSCGAARMDPGALRSLYRPSEDARLRAKRFDWHYEALLMPRPRNRDCPPPTRHGQNGTRSNTACSRSEELPCSATWPFCDSLKDLLVILERIDTGGG
jgi:hypothetical protein